MLDDALEAVLGASVPEYDDANDEAE